MKITSLTLCAFVTLLVFASCKKDSGTTTPPPPAQTDEQMSPATGKFTHYLFNGDTRDTSGLNHHGGEPTSLSFSSDRFGRSNRSASFNGSSSVFGTNGLQVSFPFSISLWMNSATPSAVSTLLKSDINTSSYYGYWLQQSIVNPGQLAFTIGDGTGVSSSSRNSLLSTVALTANQWYHIVINVRAANDMDLYINGIKDNNTSYDGSAISMVYSGSNVFGVIGAGFSGQYFNGKMDDLRTYNRVLTATEVSSLYNFQP